MKFDIDEDLRAKLEADPQLKLAVIAKAEEIKSFAQSFGPVQTGAYVGGIKVEESNGGIIVRASDWKSNWIEFGTRTGYPAHAPLRKGAEAAGLKVSSV